jgi:hypothetical protein
MDVVVGEDVDGLLVAVVVVVVVFVVVDGWVIVDVDVVFWKLTS